MSVTSKPITRSITLKKGEKFFLNGALMRVGGPVKIDICTTDSVLLPYHIIEEQNISTPLHRVYYCIQQALIEEKKSIHWLAMAGDLSNSDELKEFKNLIEEPLMVARQGRMLEALLQIRETIKFQYGTFNGCQKEKR
jgi:flagellar protein FlbT